MCLLQCIITREIFKVLFSNIKNSLKSLEIINLRFINLLDFLLKSFIVSFVVYNRSPPRRRGRSMEGDRQVEPFQ